MLKKLYVDLHDNPDNEANNLVQNFVEPTSPEGKIAPFNKDKELDFWRDRGKKINQGRNWVSRKWIPKDARYNIPAHWQWETIHPSLYSSLGAEAENPNNAENFAQKNRAWIVKRPTKLKKKINKTKHFLGVPIGYIGIERLQLKKTIDKNSFFVELDDEGWAQLEIKEEKVKDKNGNELKGPDGTPLTKRVLKVHGFENCNEKQQLEMAKDLIAYFQMTHPGEKLDITNGSQEFKSAMLKAANAAKPMVILTPDSMPADNAPRVTYRKRFWRNRVHGSFDTLKFFSQNRATEVKNVGGAAVKTTRKVGGTVKKGGKAVVKGGGAVAKKIKKILGL